jgi:hypothetical protein
VNLNVHLHFHPAGLDSVINLLKAILMKQTEAVAVLAQSAQTLDKISGETTSLLTEIQTLRDIIAGMDNVSPELEAAVNAVAARATAIDGLVPDPEAPTGG